MTDIIDETAVNVFTDGSSYSHPRRGGLGMIFVVVDENGDEVLHEHSPPGYSSATNNQMELKACAEALGFLTSKYSPIDLSQFSKIVINTDSRYVVNNFGRAKFEWRKTRWHTRDGAPVANAQIWKELVRIVTKLLQRVEIRWIKGHKSSDHNKTADRMAKLSAKGHLRAPLTTVSVRRK